MQDIGERRRRRNWNSVSCAVQDISFGSLFAFSESRSNKLNRKKTLFWLVKWLLIGDISVLLLLLLETFWLVCLCAITIVCVYIMSRITVEWFIRHNKTPQRNVTFWFVNENFIHNPFQGKWLEAKMLLT